MKNGCGRCLFFLVAVIFIVGCAQPRSLSNASNPCDAALPPFSTPVTHEEVRLAFYKYSAPAIVRKLMENDAANWNMIMKKIAEGDADWIYHAAAYIRPGADAGSTEEFTDALALALRYNPGEVLLLEQGIGISMLNVCSLPFVEPEYDFVKSYGQKALAALRKVDNPWLEESRATCLRRLQEQMDRAEKDYQEGRWGY